MIKLIDLKDRHKGAPAMVLGGGPSLVVDLDRLRGTLVSHDFPFDYARLRAKGDPLIIAVNHHALCAGIEPDYMVFMDDPIHHPLLFQTAKDYGGIKLCPLLQYTDVDMRGVPYWNGETSSLPAVWLACYFGCDPVFLCGFDCYQGNVMYCHEGERGDKPVYKRPLEDHLERWKRGFLPGVCPGIERVRAVSGPLVEVFGTIKERM